MLEKVSNILAPNGDLALLTSEELRREVTLAQWKVTGPRFANPRAVNPREGRGHVGPGCPSPGMAHEVYVAGKICHPP